MRAWYSLGVLTIVTLIAFVDRNILLLQAEVIRKALSLSDLQLGLLQGTAVAAFTALATYPLGPTTLQALAPSRLRARSVALVSVIAAAGGAIAPLITGFVSDHFKALPNGLMLSAAMVSIPALALAVLLLGRSEKHYLITAEASRQADAEAA